MIHYDLHKMLKNIRVNPSLVSQKHNKIIMVLDNNSNVKLVIGKNNK